jgi:hypothetical protein
VVAAYRDIALADSSKNRAAMTPPARMMQRSWWGPQNQRNHLFGDVLKLLRQQATQ